MQKYEIINLLIAQYGYRRFLEISTPTTGKTFGNVDSRRLDLCHRYIYNSPEFRDDGQGATYRSASQVSHQMLRAIRGATSARPPYDAIFVDPFHTYANTAIDLAGAFTLLEGGGVMVVHDCSPVDPEIVGAEYKRGNWCGLTYAAFIDFVMRRGGLSYYTVDCDYGCGVVFKRRTAAVPDEAAERESDRLSFEWEIVRGDDVAQYAFFDQNRTALLNLISVAEFVERESAG